MSSPTMTHSHIWMHDCNDKTGWSADGAHESGLPCTLTSIYGDYFKLEGTCDNAADEYAYYEYDVADYSTTDYPYVLVRWRTSAASNGLQAKIMFDYTVGTYTLALGYSQTWKTTLITLAGAKTVDKIQLYADDEPDAVDSGTYQVYYDHILCFGDTFTFPKCNVQLNLPKPRIADIQIPGREGQVLQNLGSEKAQVHLWGEMTQESTISWGTPKGQRLYQWAHEMGDDLWQWFTWPSQSLKFKATLSDAPQILFDGSTLSFGLWLKEYKLADAAVFETYSERFGHV